MNPCKRLALWLLGICLSGPAAALAQERPNENEMFGGSSQQPASDAAAAPEADGGAPAEPPPAAAADQSGDKPAAAQTPAASAASTSRDNAVLGGSDRPMFSEEAAPDDPLRIGGLLYLRAQTTAQESQKVSDYRLNAPSLVDVYFDARPNDRVRGFVRGRLSYDPLLPSSAAAQPSLNTLQASGGTSGSASLSSLFGTATSAPQAVLDQLWLRFDIDHTLFVTAGRQHVRWGTARFWTPADFLHLRKRNPLDVFDARTGTDMLKVHLPIESNAWNFYGYGIMDGQTGTPDLSTLAGAVRAEFVLGQTELGLGVFGRPHTRAKFAADLSSGIGDADVYAEVGLLDARQSDRVRYAPDAELPPPNAPEAGQSTADVERATFQRYADTIYPVYRQTGYRPQFTVGLNYSVRYAANDVFTFGGEYFYNGLGYDDYHVYPGLVLPHSDALNNPASFFYLGQHYAALFITFPSPFKLDLHTFTLSTLGNLSDRSFITRFDYALVLLTHLRFEAFASARYGRGQGEFRAGFQLPPIYGMPINLAPAIFDLGVALRLSI